MPNKKALAGINAALVSRPGTVKESLTVAPTPEPQGLILSDVVNKPLSFFRLNPENEVFRRLKTEQDYADLERAIKETGIVEPLEAMPDGLLLKGESRLIVAKRLGMATLPVRLVVSPLTIEEQKRILWLDNLARVEIDEATRLWMYAELWPGYFRAKGDDTVSPPTKAEIAAATGKSARQVARDRAIVEEADKMAKDEGRETTPDDVRQAQGKRAAERREKTGAAPENPAIVRVRQIIAEMRAESEGWTKAGREGALTFARYADMIEEALR